MAEARSSSPAQFDPAAYWHDEWAHILAKREREARFHPSRHRYTTHSTYTGKHCAMCGRPEGDHSAQPPPDREEPRG